MTQIEREEAIENIKRQLNHGYIDFSETFDYNEIEIIKEKINKDVIQDTVYKDGIFVCPNCEASTFPLVLYDGDYCVKCGQHIRWREIVKYQF